MFMCVCVHGVCTRAGRVGEKNLFLVLKVFEVGLVGQGRGVLHGRHHGQRLQHLNTIHTQRLQHRVQTGRKLKRECALTEAVIQHELSQAIGYITLFPMAEL